MFVGHLAVALAAKKIRPNTPLPAAVGAAFGLDLLWPILILVGVEIVRVNPGETAFTGLAFDSYPWSHSLALVILWSAIGVVAARWTYGSWGIGAVLGGLVASHWVLDFVTHRPDLPLWPQGPMVGLGLWGSVRGTIVVEGALFLGGLALYLDATKARDRVGRVALFAMILLATSIWISQPWAPPPPSAVAVAWGAMGLWILLPWSAWIERHRESVAS